MHDSSVRSVVIPDRPSDENGIKTGHAGCMLLANGLHIEVAIDTSVIIGVYSLPVILYSRILVYNGHHETSVL